MIKNTMRIISALTLIFLFSTHSIADIKVSQSISHEKIAFEDSVQFQIIVEWEGSQTDYRFHKPLSPYIDRMKIGQFSSSVSSLMRNEVEFTQKKYTYSLIPTSAGLGIVDSISIGYLKRNDSIPNFVVTEPMNVLIANPIAKVADEELNEWYIFGLALFLIIGIFLAVRWKKNSQSKEIQLSPKDQFLLDLTTVKNNAESDLKNFQTEFYAALSIFIVTNYNLDVSVVNSEKLIDELSNAGMSMANAEQIQQWLQKAAIDKFAPATQNPGAVIRLESEIRTFFDKI